MVIGRPLRDIAKDLVGADDLPELQRRVGIVRLDVGVSTFHGLTEGGPETFSIILRKGPEQIVKRFHPRPAAGFPGLRPKFPPRICCGALVPTDLHRLWIMLIQYGRKMTRGTARTGAACPSDFRCAAIVDPTRTLISDWTARSHNPAPVVAQAMRGRDDI